MLSWSQPLLAKLDQLWSQEKMPPSLLITGDVGIGVSETAMALAQLLRCQQSKAGQRCGQCTDCHLINAASHPDFLHIACETGKKQIGIDQVRRANEFATTRPQVARCKVILVSEAERLNTASANAILKTLEEPASSVVFILASERPGKLLPTIRSRCQTYVLPLPTQTQALSYLVDQPEPERLLSLARNRPILAESLASAMGARETLLRLFSSLLSGEKNSVEVAAEMAKLEQTELFVWLQAWLVDLVRQCLHPGQHLQDPQGLASMIEHYPSADRLMHWVDQQITDMAGIQSGQSLNIQSWLESLLIDLLTMLRRVV